MLLETPRNLNTTQVYACRATHPPKTGIRTSVFKKCSKSQAMTKRRVPVLMSFITCVWQDAVFTQYSYFFGLGLLPDAVKRTEDVPALGISKQ